MVRLPCKRDDSSEFTIMLELYRDVRHIELLEIFNIDLCNLFELSNLLKARLPAKHDNSIGIAYMKL